MHLLLCVDLSWYADEDLGIKAPFSGVNMYIAHYHQQHPSLPSTAHMPYGNLLLTLDL